MSSTKLNKKMPAETHKKTTLITGGTRGIGRAVARALAAENAGTLLLNYLENDKAALQTKAELEAMGAAVHLLRYNLAFPAEINQLFEAVREHTPALDYFVHCAALTTFKPLRTVKPNQWDLTMNISARSFLQCVQGCIPLMPDGGRVVAISSTGSRRFNMDYGALGVAKSALESMVQYLAVELAPQNIQVNGVVPGLIRGDQLPPFPNVDEVVAETLRRTPAGRLGTVEDIADMVLFLLTKANWIYGQNIVVDGGYCLT